uniref:Uncharacterized protein n=1 Tax=Cyclopterus lumpus TaxID=8103 RepID=A0A8C3ANJ4_CYCLU
GWVNTTVRQTCAVKVRNHTCAKCAVKDSARVPTSSPTAESTAATGPSGAPAVSTASSAGWTYSATERRTLGSRSNFEKNTYVKALYSVFSTARPVHVALKYCDFKYFHVNN